MKDFKENLNDTKYLLEDTDFKNNTTLDEQNIKNTLLNNTQLLLEDKSSIFIDISNDNVNQNQNINKKEIINNNNNNVLEKEKKIEQENSIKDILIKNNININVNEDKEKLKDEQEIIKQQNILLNNQSSHLDELFSLSYTDIPHNKNTINTYNNKTINNNNININNKQIYFGTLFPTEKVIKNICYKNDIKKKIICFKLSPSKKDENYNNEKEYFKLLIDKNNNKNYYNIKSNEEINLKILLEAPFIKTKKELKYNLEIIDINNILIDKYILYANIEIPKLCCLKYKNNINQNIKEYNIPLIQIKINLENNNDINKSFKIPIKNMCMKDLKINFNLINNPNDENNIIIKDYLNYEIILDNEKGIIIPSLDINYIEFLINIKLKKKINDDFIKIKKILRVNVIDTKIAYYFCFEIYIININNNNDNIINNKI